MNERESGEFLNKLIFGDTAFKFPDNILELMNMPTNELRAYARFLIDNPSIASVQQRLDLHAVFGERGIKEI